MNYRTVTLQKLEREKPMTPYLGTEEVKMLNSIVRTFVFTEIADLMDLRTKDKLLQQTCNLTPSDRLRTQYDPRSDLGTILSRCISAGEREKIFPNLIGPQPTVESHYSMVKFVKVA